jgi:hypothetical protein
VPVWVKHEDLARARQILHERDEASRTLDWDQVDVGEREDSLPLRPVRTVPWLAKLGFALAAAILILSAVFVIVVVVL